jgi:hypothetical protein
LYYVSQFSSFNTPLHPAHITAAGRTNSQSKQGMLQARSLNHEVPWRFTQRFHFLRTAEKVCAIYIVVQWVIFGYTSLVAKLPTNPKTVKHIQPVELL